MKFTILTARLELMAPVNKIKSEKSLITSLLVDIELMRTASIPNNDLDQWRWTGKLLSNWGERSEQKMYFNQFSKLNSSNKQKRKRLLFTKFEIITFFQTDYFLKITKKSSKMASGPIVYSRCDWRTNPRDSVVVAFPFKTIIALHLNLILLFPTQHLPKSRTKKSD